MQLETAAEIEQAIEDTDGVTVVLGADSTFGHFEVLDEVVLSPTEVLVGAPTVVVATGVLTGLAIDAAITVDGNAYTVRDHRRFEDGRLTRILLRVV